ARCASRIDVDVLRGVGEDGARELAHLLTADEVRVCRWELPADQFTVHGHPPILPGSPIRALLGAVHTRQRGRDRNAFSAICTAITTRYAANRTLPANGSIRVASQAPSAVVVHAETPIRAAATRSTLW